MSLSSFLFGKNPADVASPYLQQSKDIYNPYVDIGQKAGQNVSGLYQDWANDPVANYNKIMEQYKESPQFQHMRDQRLAALNNTSAAGGMGGSYQNLEGSADLAEALSSEDMQKWIQSMLGMQQQGAAGQSHLYDQGLGATNQQSNALTNQGGMAFQGQQQNNMNRSALLSSLMSGAGAFLTGGPTGVASLMAGGMRPQGQRPVGSWY